MALQPSAINTASTNSLLTPELPVTFRSLVTTRPVAFFFQAKTDRFGIRNHAFPIAGLGRRLLQSNLDLFSDLLRGIPKLSLRVGCDQIVQPVAQSGKTGIELFGSLCANRLVRHDVCRSLAAELFQCVEQPRIRSGFAQLSFGFAGDVKTDAAFACQRRYALGLDAFPQGKDHILQTERVRRRYRNWRRTVQRLVRSGTTNGDSAVQLSLDGGAEA